MKNSIKEYALKNMEEIEALEETADENEHIIELWEPLEFNIDEKYEYVSKNKLFQICSDFLYYIIAFPILTIFTKIVYGLKIEGKEKIRNIKDGAISVSNHVLILDCAMVGLSAGRKKIYYTTTEDSFKIPLVRKLIKLLRAMPIPTKIKDKEKLIKNINELLRNKNIVHFYPERALFPYYTKIRNFKNGAFTLAVKNNVPIIPMVFTFREPKGIRKKIKTKKDVTLTILDPIYPSIEEKDIKQKTEELKQEVYLKMQEMNNRKYKQI